MILVVAEQREGKLNRASWEAVAAAQQLAAGMPIKILVLGGATGSGPTDLAAAGVAEGLLAEHPAFRADAARRGAAAAPVTRVEPKLDVSAIRQKPEAPFQEAKAAVDLSQAERIVAVGRGIKSQENLAIAQKLATALGAELAASRPICDNGWLPMERQIGSSGQTVAPKLYVALDRKSVV